MEQEQVNTTVEVVLPPDAPTEDNNGGKKKKKEKKDHVKNVNIKQCIFTIIGALLGCLALLLPATFGDKFTFLFEYTPFISKAESFDMTSTMFIMQGLNEFFKFDESILEYILIAFSYAPYVYFGILAIDVLFALLLIITRSQIMRIIFKVISILLAFVMLAFAICYIAYIVGFAGLFIFAICKIEDLITALNNSGLLVALGFVVFGFIFTGKQLKWFARLY